MGEFGGGGPGKIAGMNLTALIGWALAVLAVASGYLLYGWGGVLLGLGLVVFWLLLQFTRVMRAMRLAGQAPVGHVDSAVMLNAKLVKGMRLIDIIQLTRSLGTKLADEPETYRWQDNSGAAVELQLVHGRCTGWAFSREAQAPTGSPPQATA